MIEIETKQPKSNQLNFRSALVIQEAGALRISVMELLRKRGWLAHGVSRAKQAFDILPHIPYDLIVFDAELADISGMDFIRVLHTSRKWQTIQFVVITSSNSASLANQVQDCGAFLARKTTWEDDLFEFLSTLGEGCPDH